MTERLELKALTVSNLLRLEAVHLEFDGPDAVVIGGRNGQGKSSIIDSIHMAVAWRAAAIGQPVRDGATKGTSVVDLGKYIVTMTVTAEGKRTLKVTNREGAKFSNPAALLDAVIGDLSFDPMVFARQSSKDQVDALRRLSGLDFSELDRARKVAFEKRTDVNRDGKKLAAQLEGMPRHDDAPGEKVSVGDLVAILDEASRLERDRQGSQDAVNRLAEDSDRIHSQLAQATSELQALAERVETMKRQADEASRVSDEATAGHATYCIDNPVPDIAEVKAKIAGADEQNQKLAQNEAHAAAAKQLAALRKESKALGEEIDGVDAEKKELLEAADLPVKGMSFDENGVTINGILFAQCSSAEQITASFAMAVAASSGLPLVIIRDGSLLDDDAKRLVKALAKEHGVKLIMEVVGNSDDVTVLMEDGAVVEAEAEVAA